MLKNDLAEPRAEKLWTEALRATKPFGSVKANDLEQASAPRTDQSIADYRDAVALMNQVDAAIKADVTDANEPAPNGLDTMRSAFSAAKN